MYRVVAGTQSLGLGLSASRDLGPATQDAAPAAAPAGSSATAGSILDQRTGRARSRQPTTGTPILPSRAEQGHCELHFLSPGERDATLVPYHPRRLRPTPPVNVAVRWNLVVFRLLSLFSHSLFISFSHSLYTYFSGSLVSASVSHLLDRSRGGEYFFQK